MMKTAMTGIIRSVRRRKPAPPFGPTTVTCQGIDELIEQVQSYHPSADIDLLRRAYCYSEKMHASQLRLSGEPYLQHPLAVASVLSALRLDVPPIAAGLLHDVLEDTDCTREQLEHAFGEEIARLVDGVTKIGKVEFKSDEEKQAENFRKMLISMAADIRVIIIKLADRLHNMRTLAHLHHARKLSIARETLDIYSPLANRLGIGWIKTALEDLCLKFLKPEIYESLQAKVAKRLEERQAAIDELIAIVQDSLAMHRVKSEVTGRPKHLYSIYQKMERQGIAFEEIYDLTAIRILTKRVIDCYAALGVVHSLWSPVAGRFKDYIGVPKSNLYQSLHTTVVGPKGEHAEFQIRTEEMHRMAEEGIAAHWQYKEPGKVDKRDERIFKWLRQMVEWHKDLSDNRQFMNSVKFDLYSDVIYVFTPQGDVKELVAGATPVDFAYSVHTEVGNHCLGAKVNGKMVPLDTVLRSGDTVQILTSSSRVPSKDWLKFVRTPSAKTKIKHWIRTAERERSIALGQRLLEKALRRHGMVYSQVIKSDPFLQAARDLSFHSAEELVSAVGVGQTSASQIIKRVESLTQRSTGASEPPAPPHQPGAGQPQPEHSVKVLGMSGMLFHFSRCCHPVPGDPIIGFITRGRGLSIHAAGCQNLDLLDCYRERFVDVEWDSSSEKTHPACIAVLTVNRPGILASVSSMITKANVNIGSADVTETRDGKAALNFVVEVMNATQLDRVLKSIERLDGVLSAKRVHGRSVGTDRYRRPSMGDS